MMKFERLGTIAEIIAGQSPPSSAYNKNGQGLPFFQGKADYGEIYPNIRNWTKIVTKLSIPNDILISVRAPVGPVNLNNVQACIGRGLSAIRVNSNVYNKYIFYYLKLNQDKINRLAVGSTFTAITQKDLFELNIPLPPTLEDQVKIAHLLTQTENLIVQRNKGIVWADEYLKTTFFTMFGDPVKGNKFHRYTFKEISTVRQGLQIPISKRQSTPGGNRYPYITNQFINGGKVAEYVENPKASVICKSDDILMTRTGNTGIVLTDVEGVFHNNFFLIDYNRKLVNKKYLVSFLRLPQIRKIILNKASTTTIPDLNHGDFYKITIPIPPLDLQNKFAAIVEKTEALKQQMQQSLQELETLFASLSQRAFKGELVLGKLKVTYEEEYSATDNDRTEPKPIDWEKVLVAKKPISEMSLDDFYGIPEEVRQEHGSIEHHQFDWEFFFKKHFQDRPVTSDVVEDLYTKYNYERGLDFPFDEFTNIVFTELQKEDSYLKQIFSKDDKKIELRITS